MSFGASQHLHVHVVPQSLADRSGTLGTHIIPFGCLKLCALSSEPCHTSPTHVSPTGPPSSSSQLPQSPPPNINTAATTAALTPSSLLSSLRPILSTPPLSPHRVSPSPGAHSFQPKNSTQAGTSAEARGQLLPHLRSEINAHLRADNHWGFHGYAIWVCMSMLGCVEAIIQPELNQAGGHGHGKCDSAMILDYHESPFEDTEAEDPNANSGDFMSLRQHADALRDCAHICRSRRFRARDGRHSWCLRCG